MKQIKKKYKKDKRDLIQIRKSREKIIKRLLRPTKIKIIIFLCIIGLSIVFQGWNYNIKCLEIICEPIFLGFIYYLFWPFDLFNIWIMGILPPTIPLLFIIKIITLIVQVVYWYLLTCFIIIPINKIRGLIGRKIWKNRLHENKIILSKIERDLKKADELEKKKMLEVASVV